MRLTRNRRDIEERFTMIIKEFTYLTQQSLQSSTGSTFKRTHIYELLAAFFDFNSYAALSAESVFTQDSEDTLMQLQQDENQQLQLHFRIQQRCTELGYSDEIVDTVLTHLDSSITQSHIGVVKVSDLIDGMRSDSFYAFEYLEWNDNEISPILLDELESSASKNNQLSHYALALINATDESEDEETSNDYWYKQEQQGHVLTGATKEWADIYKKGLDKAKKYAFHLKEAARLGSTEALLDLADKFDDPSFFEARHEKVDEDPLRVAEIAEALGREEDMKFWLIIAAEKGDIEAIIRLIEEPNHDNLEQCWTWIYLAQMLGTDLTKDDYHAIHENGSHYDDDIGGPMYVDGRSGINLNPLNTAQSAIALQAAKELFKKI